MFPERRRSVVRTLALVVLTCLFAVPGAGAAGAAGATLPQGNWEVLSASGSTVTVAGWALDRDVPTASIPVHVYVDGGGSAVTADVDRPDVGAAFPGAGNAHGFSHSRTVSPGVHTVCVYAIDVDNGARNTPLGCRSIAVRAALPVGNWEVLSTTAGTLSVAGWALDSDAPTASIPVHVYVDGGGAAVTANAGRPDVGAAFPGAGSAHGFSHTRDVISGVHTVCVYAIDVDNPWWNTPLGCRSVTAAVAPPIGNFDRAWGSGGTLNVSGWALDPNQPSEPATFEVYIDGRLVLVTGAVEDRPDVGSAFPGAGNAHGFTEAFSVAEFSLSPGAHEVCVWARVFLPAETLGSPLGCRTVAIGPTLPIGNWEGVSVSGDTVQLFGWALDPDNPAYNPYVEVQVDGRVVNNQPASSSRPDVGAAFPGAGDLHGWSAAVQASPGERSVCVFVTDLDDSSKKTALGCRTVGVQVTPPVGNYDTVSASAGRLTASGWALDPDHEASVAFAHVYVDGRYAGQVLANGSRPDVGAAFPGAGDAHGWSYTADVSPGVHTVCAFAIDVEIPTRNTPLGCRQVTVPPGA